jgi:hypothetical protein
MKKKKEAAGNKDGTPSQEEYRLFLNQPEAVLKDWRAAKTSMAFCLPVFAFFAVFYAIPAILTAVAAGFSFFFLAKKKYGFKSACAPLVCAFLGAVLGIFLLSPLMRLIQR